MAYQLRNGLSWCEIAHHVLFLDLPEDRYFCLSGTAADAFRAAAQGNNLDGVQARAAEQLVHLDIIRVSDQPEIPQACQNPLPLRTWPADTLSIRDIGAVIWRYSGARTALLHTGLQAALTKLSRCKRLDASSDPTCRAIGSVTTAVRMLGWFRSSREHCLPRAIALAHVLAARGVPANLVIGVSLHPFRAHAWVQVDDALICDDVDIVRLYAPILVI